MKKILLALCMCATTSFAFAQAEVEALDRATNVFATNVAVSSSSMATVRVGVNATKPTVVLNDPGYAPVVIKNVAGVMTVGSALSVAGVTNSGAVTGTTGSLTGALDVDGQTTLGADGTKSTVTTTGAATFHTSVTAPAIVGSTSVSGAKVTASAGPMTLTTKTLLELRSMTPDAAGEVYYCSNCSTTLVISTGTTIGGFATPGRTTIE